MNRKIAMRFLVTVTCILSVTAQAFDQSGQWEELRKLPFRENYPTTESADRLHDEIQFQRACQVVSWSLPAMALWAMKKGSEAQFGEGSNIFPIWKDRLNAETIAPCHARHANQRLQKISRDLK